eukprot:g4444.t1
MTSYVVVLLLLCIRATNGLIFNVVARDEKCLGEEIGDGVLVSGKFEVLADEGGHSGVAMHVFDPQGSVVFSSIKKLKGDFNFETVKDGEHRFCIRNDASVSARISFDLFIGANARFKEAGPATQASIAPIESALLYLEVQLKNLQRKVQDIRGHEAEMEETTDNMRQRLLGFSFLTMFVLVSLGCWEIFTIKRYFKSKKII